MQSGVRSKISSKSKSPRKKANSPQRSYSGIFNTLTDGLDKGSSNLKNKISVFSKNTKDFRNLLNTSKGRDKFTQLLQYSAHFYRTCMQSSEIFGEAVRLKQV